MEMGSLGISAAAAETGVGDVRTVVEEGEVVAWEWSGELQELV